MKFDIRRFSTNHCSRDALTDTLSYVESLDSMTDSEILSCLVRMARTYDTLSRWEKVLNVFDSFWSDGFLKDLGIPRNGSAIHLYRSILKWSRYTVADLLDRNLEYDSPQGRILKVTELFEPR